MDVVVNRSVLPPEEGGGSRGPQSGVAAGIGYHGIGAGVGDPDEGGAGECQTDGDVLIGFVEGAQPEVNAISLGNSVFHQLAGHEFSGRIGAGGRFCKSRGRVGVDDREA